VITLLRRRRARFILDRSAAQAGLSLPKPLLNEYLVVVSEGIVLMAERV
jgi:hypothetical protein